MISMNSTPALPGRNIPARTSPVSASIAASGWCPLVRLCVGAASSLPALVRTIVASRSKVASSPSGPARPSTRRPGLRLGHKRDGAARLVPARRRPAARSTRMAPARTVPARRTQPGLHDREPLVEVLADGRRRPLDVPAGIDCRRQLAQRRLGRLSGAVAALRLLPAPARHGIGPDVEDDCPRRTPLAN
jgi:hypothetical protein